MNHRTRSTGGRRSGFTLVEMLLVLVILATLAALVYPKMSKHTLRARRIQTHAQIQIFRTALAQYEMDNDHFPSTSQGLAALVNRPGDAKRWHGPYLEKKTIPRDPWKNNYLYVCPGAHNPDGYDLYSAAQDGVPGTEDDITSWEPDQEE